MGAEDAPPAYTPVVMHTSATAPQASKRAGNIAKVHILAMVAVCVLAPFVTLWFFKVTHNPYEPSSPEYGYAFLVLLVVSPLISPPFLACGYYGIAKRRTAFIVPLIIYTGIFFTISLIACVVGIPLLCWSALVEYKKSGVYTAANVGIVIALAMLGWSKFFLSSVIDARSKIRNEEDYMAVNSPL